MIEEKIWIGDIKLDAHTLARGAAILWSEGHADGLEEMCLERRRRHDRTRSRLLLIPYDSCLCITIRDKAPS